MRAGLYARVSTREQAEEGLSLSAQLVALRRHCEASGWSVVEEYVDEGLSAAKESARSRPAFRRMLSDADEGRLDVVIVHKLDRFSRNVQVTLESLSRLEKAKASFVSLSEEIDYTTPMGRLMLTMLGGIAAWYSDNLATEVSKGRAERARMGLWNGDLPFGYWAKDARSVPQPVPGEAEAVRGMFERYASGVESAHDVALWLNEQGFEPRSKRGRTRFTKATVMDMLGNPFYAGFVRYKGEVLPGAHEGLVSEELFELAAAARARRRALSGAVKRRPARVYMLRGIARCSRCGSVLWCGPVSRGKVRSYRDASRDRQQECPAKKRSVRAEAVEEQVGRLMSMLEMPEEWGSVVYRLMRESAAEPLEQVRAKRKRLQERLVRARELRLMGELTLAQFKAEQMRARSELDALAVSDAPELDMEKVVGLLRGMGRVWGLADEVERAELVGRLFEEVWVDTEEGCVVAVKPRAAFGPVLRALWERGVLSGDPDRPRVASSALWHPYLELIVHGYALPVGVAV